MNYSTLLRRNAAWGLAAGVLIACSSVDSTPPSSYGYPPIDAGSVGTANNATGAGASSSGGDMPAPAGGGQTGGTSSGPTGSSNGGNGGNGGGGGVCPSNCSSNSDCAPCGMPPGMTGQNCCVMGLCALMTTCPVIRDAGGRRDGS